MRNRRFKASASIAATLFLPFTVVWGQVTLISVGDSWNYFIGTGFVEASVPSTLWRGNPFDDSAWLSGATPIGYGEADIATTIPTSATTAGNYLSVYLRKAFTISNPGDFQTLEVEVIVDDGSVAYINGTEIGRINVPGGELLSSDAAVAADERRTLSVSIPNPSAILVPGENVMAIHLLNGNQTSSDILIDASVMGVIDQQSPTIDLTLGLLPPAGATVRELTTIEVVFSEDVQGVDAADLLINSQPATNLVVVAPNQYVFEFEQPADGLVQVAFSGNAGITDTAATPNPFLGESWSYTLDPNAEPPGIIISEFMASNDDTLNDEDGDSEDWLELYNAGTISANLDGWYLTDDPSLQDLWRIPNVTLLPNSFLIIFASGKDRTNIFSPLHTDFSLSAGGEFLALLDPDMNIVSAFAPAYPAQVTDISYGRDLFSPDLKGYFDTPTPGLPNASRGIGLGPNVVFSEPSRTFIDPFSLALTTPDDPAAEIRYVLVTDAATAMATNVPTPSSTLYTGPIPISGTIQVRARAFVPGLLPGEPASESYIRMDAALASFTSDLPLVVMHNFGSSEFPSGAGSTSDDSTITMVFDTKFGVSSLTNLPDTAGRSGVNLRGSSTQGFPKRSYAVEFWDEFNQDLERPVLDFEPESDWVLYAPNQFDVSLMHNPLANRLSNDLGEWAPRTRFVEVFANIVGGNLRNGLTGSADDYRGIYVLEEKIKRDNGRLDMDPLEPEHNTAPEITGGYLLKVDRQDANERSFGAGGLTLIYQDPDGLDMVNDTRRVPQVNYIRDYVNNMNTAINAAGTGYLDWIDAKAFIDHNLVNFLTMNVDAFRLSGFMHKPRDEVDRYGRVVTPGKFKMGPVWDFDRSAGTSRGDTRPFDAFHWKGQGGDTGTHFFDQNGTFGNPWYRVLFRKIDFWQMYVDRYQELREAQFSTNHVFAIIDEFAAELANAQPREAGRNTSGGGDTRPRNGTVSAFGYSYLFDGTFAREIEFQKQWFADHMLFIDTNLVPRPLFSSTGGVVNAGFQVSLSGPSGATVYYTLDGSDPRAPGGGVAAGAQPSTGPVSINGNAMLVARALDPGHQQQTGGDAPPIATTWSGPRRAAFLVEVPGIRITEVMYHNEPAPAGSGFFDEDFEYIELKNIGPSPVNLNGYRLAGGVRFTFPDATLAAGESAVVVSYIPAFLSRYGAGPRILGEYQGLLDNNEEELVLEGRFQEPIHAFEYDDDWHPATDGFGFSLVIRDEHAPLDQWTVREGWRPGTQLGGSPGGDNGAEPGLPSPVITEALTHTDLPQVDAVEIYNPGPGAADISGWFLSDDFRTPKFRIPESTVIPENGYVAFDEGDFNLPGDTNGFNLRSSGDEIYLFSADPAGNLTGYITGWEFGASLNGVSFGLHVTSTGAREFVAQVSTSLGGPNAGPRVGPLVISEVMYHPLDLVVGNQSFGNTMDEYIEVQNLSGTAVPLYDPNAPTNTYRLRDAVDFAFPENQSLGPNARLLVVGFDPGDPVKAADFRARFGVDAGVPLYGPFDGNLSNGGESVELVQPDQVVFYTTNLVVTGVEIDRVNYGDSAPWPVAADGFGLSLQRLALADYGNDPVNWIAALPTPGDVFVPGTPPVIDVQPVDQTVVAFNDVSFSVAASGPGPLSYQWRRNESPISGAIGPVLDLSRVTAADDGLYDVIIFNGGGSVLSAPARLTVLIPASIIDQPEPASRREGESISFSVQATSSTPISYQWLFNSQEIPGATSSQLVIDPINRLDDGFYSVRVTDAVGAVTTDPVRLTVLVDPAVLNLATNLTVVQGGSITLSIETEGTLPMSYRWRKNFATLKLENLNSSVSFIKLTNVQPADGGSVRYTVVLTNEAFFQPGELSPPIFLNVLVDTDGDGMPDQFEMDHGFSTTLPDADQDFDMDGVSNGDEHTSGTDPEDDSSYIKVEGLSSDGDALVEFLAAPNVTYTVLYKDTLEAPAWNRLADVAASESARTVVIRDQDAMPQRYYKLVTPRQE